MTNLKTIYAAHFYEAASYHAQRVKLLQNPDLHEYDEDGYETCTHAAMCAEMFITGKVIEHNPSDVVPSKSLRTRNRESIALSALQDNDVNKVDINALVSLQMCGAADLFYEDDAVRIGRFFNAMVSCLCSEYLLSGSEIDELIEDLNETSSDDMKNLIMDVVKSNQQEQTIRDFLQPGFEKITAKREHFALPSDMQVDAALTEIVDIVTAD